MNGLIKVNLFISPKFNASRKIDLEPLLTGRKFIGTDSFDEPLFSSLDDTFVNWFDYNVFPLDSAVEKPHSYQAGQILSKDKILCRIFHREKKDKDLFFYKPYPYQRQVLIMSMPREESLSIEIMKVLGAGNYTEIKNESERTQEMARYF